MSFQLGAINKCPFCKITNPFWKAQYATASIIYYTIETKFKKKKKNVEKFIKCVALFYKVGSSIKNFPRKENRILVKRGYYPHVEEIW